MKFLLTCTMLLFSLTVLAGFEGFNQGQSLKIFNQIDCNAGLSCYKLKGKFIIATTGGVHNTVTATATTITSSQCGSTFINSGAVVINLPKAPVGCTLTFVTANASNFDINPNDADTILVLTNAAGDAIRNATLGNSVSLRAITATQWAATSVQGTYTDIN